MAALNFPATPSINDLYPSPPVPGQPVYTWDGEKWNTGDSVIQAMGEPSNALPLMDGDVAEAGTSGSYSRSDHRHPHDATLSPINSPHFTGIPLADTPAIGDNGDRLATTAFVTNAVFVTGNSLPSNSSPLMDGSPAPGVSILYSRDDHVHPVDTTRAPLNSPVFTGVPEAPTAAPGVNNTQVATTAFVGTAILSSGGSPSNAVPLVEGTGNAGTSLEYARGDHVHPAGPLPPAPATVNPVMSGVAAVGVATKYAREDHVHPSDTTKATTTYVDTQIATRAPAAHTHLAAQVTDFSEAVDDRVGALLVAGTNVTLDYNDTANTLTITSTAAGGGAGTGDVVGPASSVNDRIATFSGTTGKLIKDSGTLITAVQPLDAELTAIAGLVSAADRVPYFTGVGAAALTPLTTFGRSLIDDADATAAKTTLGIAGAALTAANDTNVTLTTGGSASTSLLAAASVTAGWAGTLSAARGGFGSNVSSSSGVPLFAAGVATFTGTNGTGTFVRTDSPVFTGNPTAPTPATTDNDTSVATTAFVKSVLPGSNVVINGGFRVNQSGYVSAAALSAGTYGHDQWKAGASGGDYSFTQLASSTQITIASGKSLIQPIENVNVAGGSYVLTWTGTAQARAGVNTLTPSGSYAASPLSIAGQTAGTAMSIEFNTGTLGTVKLETGSVATPFGMTDYATELALCQRYWQKMTGTLVSGYNGAGTGVWNTFALAPTMRAIPTITYSNVSASNATAIVNNGVDKNFLRVAITITAAGSGYVSSDITADARL